MDLKLTSGAVFAFLGFLAMPRAQAAENVRVRGTIVGLEGSTLTVKTREGPNTAVALTPGWKVAGIAQASVEDIKPGDLSASPPCRRRREETGRSRCSSFRPR
jgi:hypothetical protein